MKFIEAAAGGNEIHIVRPENTWGAGIVLALVLIGYLILGGSGWFVLVWMLLLLHGLTQAEERFRVYSDRVEIVRGIGFFKRNEVLRRSEISKISVSRGTDSAKRGMFGFGPPLSFVVGKHRRSFLAGASGNDAEVVAGWLK